MDALAFENQLIRMVDRNGEPWFVGRDVCTALAIRNYRDALLSLGDDEKIAGNDTSVGTTDTLISEPGVYRLVFRSRKPAAERFKRWLAHDVLPEIRRNGRYDPAARTTPTAPANFHEPATFIEALHAVREARLIHGRTRAQKLWNTLGLPHVPEAPPSPTDEARACLLHLLVARAHDGGPAIGDLIERALDGDADAAVALMPAGLRVLDGHDGFVVANNGRRIIDLYSGTPWDHGRFRRVLRRLPGATAADKLRFAGHQARGSFIPAHYLDLGAYA